MAISSDGRKLTFEFFKQVTTLDTGSILVLVAVVEKFWPKPLKPADVFQIQLILGCFVMSLFASIIWMFVLAFEGEWDIKNKTGMVFLVGSFAASGLGFFFGVALLLRQLATANGLWFFN